MTGDELRELYLSFFEEKGHLRMSGASLIPVGDPTLLLTNAGMVPFKRYLTGEMAPPNPRLTSCQKCFRTSDIDSAGDTKHLTFFEMLGNFSIGDYFKPDAIAWAWEFVTQRLGIPGNDLWVTIYNDDEEAFHLWHHEIGVPKERIYRYGPSDNWWGPAGSEGPCGPCSEIHYDFGAEYGCNPMAAPLEAADYEIRDVGCHPNCDRCGRFVELWNLVFMQYYQHLDGSLAELPRPNIDTGMGLERAAAILQGKHSIYETDLFLPIVAEVAKLAGKSYGNDLHVDEAIRVVAEHSRAIVFLAADGVVPGKEGRGYVLRRVIRRAIRFGHRLGIQGVFLKEMAQVVTEAMGHMYPELTRNSEFVLQIVGREEEQFQRALSQGLMFLEGVIPFRRRYYQELELIEELAGQDVHLALGQLQQLKVDLQKEALHDGEENTSTVPDSIIKQDAYNDIEVLISETQNWIEELISKAATDDAIRVAATEGVRWLRENALTFSGLEVFRLHDTFGITPELTQEIATENGMVVDKEGFEQQMHQQRERSRAADRFDVNMDRAGLYESVDVNATSFVGYDALIYSTPIVGFLVDGQVVTKVQNGQQVEVILRETPFYPEGGGQVGDAGEIIGEHGLVQIRDTQNPVGNLIVHFGQVLSGTLEMGELVEASVNQDHRLGSSRNHTGTHLLHAALREVLGTHIRQAGSLVAPDRLRFDFTSPNPLTQEELERVERLVNRKVREDLQIREREAPYQTALQEGALAFFGERYAEQVRVVEVTGTEPFSLEVCGGTHLKRTGEVGSFLLVSESSIGSGMRRIEALTGVGAEALIRARMNTVEEMARLLQVGPDDLEARIRTLVHELSQSHKQADALERQLARRLVAELLERVQEVAGTRVLAGRAVVSNVEALRETGDWLKEQLGSGIVVLGAVLEGRPTMVGMVTSDLVGKGFDAGSIVREAAKVMGGSGGGRPHLAQAGGRFPEKLDDALGSVPQVVASLELSQP